MSRTKVQCGDEKMEKGRNSRVNEFQFPNDLLNVAIIWDKLALNFSDRN
jgi:hypothetical protein